MTMLLMEKQPENMKEFLDRIKEADSKNGKVAVNDILEVIGRRSFSPLLLMAGIITLAPIIGDIPGVPTIMGMFVLLTTTQILIGQDHFWLPDWILRRSVKREKLVKGINWVYKPAKFIDRWTKQRLTLFVKGTGQKVIAALCLLISLAMPIMEFIPFSANIAGIAFTLFGLALVTRDGLLALVALISAAGAFGFIVYSLI